MSSLLGFLLAIIVLVTIHEYGHFIVARLFGVKVLRFSVGFGRSILEKVDSKGTKFCLGYIPLGGYVKMLDTREIDDPQQLLNLSEEEKSQAFDLQRPWKKILIVAAGPLINLIFPILLFTIVSYGNHSVLLPVLGEVKENSVIHQSGLRKNDKITAIDDKEIDSWPNMILTLLDKSIDHAQVTINFVDYDGDLKTTILPLKNEMSNEGFMWKDYGLTMWSPDLSALIGGIQNVKGGDNSALKIDDEIISINRKTVKSWQELVQQIQSLPNQKVSMIVLRDGLETPVDIRIGSQVIDGVIVGLLGVKVAVPEGAWSPVTTTIHRGVIDALIEGTNQTQKIISLIVKSVASMFVGKMSLANLGGPITIAQQAGQYAELGLQAFLSFLGLLSISLGILNLLPIPLLDGGHIVLHTWEMLTGKTPSNAVQLMFQRIGLALVIGLLVVAFSNDILRFF